MAFALSHFGRFCEFLLLLLLLLFAQPTFGFLLMTVIKTGYKWLLVGALANHYDDLSASFYSHRNKSSKEATKMIKHRRITIETNIDGIAYHWIWFQISLDLLIISVRVFGGPCTFRVHSFVDRQFVRLRFAFHFITFDLLKYKHC